MVLCDDPQRLVLLAGFPPDPQHHPVAAPHLVLENHADSAPGQIDGGADEPGTLAFPPSTAMQPQVILAFCSKKKTPLFYFLGSLATSVSSPCIPHQPPPSPAKPESGKLKIDIIRRS